MDFAILSMEMESHVIVIPRDEKPTEINPRIFTAKQIKSEVIVNPL
jgi:hypothetical protein